jgi:cyclophilin family peptidyl-prolyl cis-trans isomerase
MRTVISSVCPDRCDAFSRRAGLISPRRLVALLCGALICSAGAHSALAGTLVNLNFANFGTVQVDLFSEVTPATEANFLQYVNSDRYDDTIIHRVDIPNGVIQGGGYNPDASPIATFDPVVNESFLHNSRGTIGMARTQDINSARGQWFINTQDNTTNFGLPTGQGYTVFGWVVGGGMTAVDSIAAVPTFTYASPFSQFPLQNFTQEDKNNGVSFVGHTVDLTSVEIASTHPTFQNPISRVDVNNDGLLTPLDMLTIINSMNSNGIHDVDPFESNPFAYRDVNGDGLIAPVDLINVVNAILEHGGGGPAPLALVVGPSVTPMVVVPEPSSWMLAAWSLFAAAALAGSRFCRTVGAQS